MVIVSMLVIVIRGSVRVRGRGRLLGIGVSL
jgi:hypothetical protein